MDDFNNKINDEIKDIINNLVVNGVSVATQAALLNVSDNMLYRLKCGRYDRKIRADFYLKMKDLEKEYIKN